MPSPNDLTRQQLDELDALLQRMLAGPGSPAPAPVVPPPTQAPTGWRADVPAAVPASPAPHLTPTLAEVPEAVVVPRANPFAYAPEPAPAYFPKPTPVTTYQPGEPAAYEVPEDDRPVDFSPIPLTPPIIEPEPPAPPTSVAVPGPGVPALLYPLFVTSRVLEFALNLFGPPGQMLTSNAGKNLLAAVGFVLMAGAGIWYARGLGLLQIPFLP